MKQQLTINLTPGDVTPVAYFNQYDVIVGGLELYLIDNGQPYTDAYTAEIDGVKPDGKIFQYFSLVSENIVTVDVTEQMTAVAGNTTCELRLRNRAGDIDTGTINFVLSIEESPFENMIISESDFATLQTVLNNAENYASNAATSASEAATSASEAATSATNAATSATTASSKASTASTKASNASTYASNASASATAAANSATAAEAALASVNEAISSAVDSTVPDAVNTYIADNYSGTVPDAHIYAGTGSTAANEAVTQTTSNTLKIIVAEGNTVKNYITLQGTGCNTVNSTADGVVKVSGPTVANNLTTSNSGYVLDARMGKDLKTSISANAQNIASNTTNITTLQTKTSAFSSLIILTQTLTAGETTISFQNSAITSNSSIEIYTETYGVAIKSMAVSGNICTVEIKKAQTANMGIRIHVWNPASSS